VNKWVIIGIIILVLILIGIGYDQGLFDNLDGSFIGIILAGLAAPYLAIKNWLVGDKFQRQFKERYDKMKSDEIIHRTDYDHKIMAKEKRIAELNREVQLLDSKLEVLELKKSKVEQSVKEMSIDSTKREAKDLFGD
jgi:hypothetical protein